MFWSIFWKTLKIFWKSKNPPPRRYASDHAADVYALIWLKVAGRQLSALVHQDRDVHSIILSSDYHAVPRSYLARGRNHEPFSEVRHQFSFWPFFQSKSQNTQYWNVILCTSSHMSCIGILLKFRSIPQPQQNVSRKLFSNLNLRRRCDVGLSKAIY